MEDLENKEEAEKQEGSETDLPCAGCDEESTGCSGCGGGRKRVDTWWYIIAALVVLLVAVLIARAQPGST